MNADWIATLAVMGVPLLVVVVQQQRGINRQSSILERMNEKLDHLKDKADSNELIHADTSNLCRMADDSFRRGLASDVAVKVVSKMNRKGAV